MWCEGSNPSEWVEGLFRVEEKRWEVLKVLWE